MTRAVAVVATAIALTVATPAAAQPSGKVARIGLLVTGALDSAETRVALDALRADKVVE